MQGDPNNALVMDPDSPSHTDGTAANRVFETVELLEAMLLEVGECTLLQLQRVNKTYRDTIKESIKLQRKLWFQPTNGSEETPLQINPLVFRGLTLNTLSCVCSFRQNVGGPIISANFTAMEKSYESPGSREQGSWRNMPVTNTSEKVKCSFLCTKYSYREDWREALEAVRRSLQTCATRRWDKGLTAGMLAEWIEKEWDLKHGMRLSSL